MHNCLYFHLRGAVQAGKWAPPRGQALGVSAHHLGWEQVWLNTSDVFPFGSCPPPNQSVNQKLETLTTEKVKLRVFYPLAVVTCFISLGSFIRQVWDCIRHWGRCKEFNNSFNKYWPSFTKFQALSRHWGYNSKQRRYSICSRGRGDRNKFEKKKKNVRWEKYFDQIEQGKGIESKRKGWRWVRQISIDQQDFFEEVIWNIIESMDLGLE